MGQVTEAEVAAAIGRVDEMILREVVRTQASSGAHHCRTTCIACITCTVWASMPLVQIRAE